MKINEIIKEDPQEPQPDASEIKAVQDLIGTIDPQNEKPEGLLTKLTSWMRVHPLLDKVTDLIPQTRLVKAIASAVDSLEDGDKMGALNSLASGLTGNAGKAVATLAKTANTATALAQGDLKGAAMAAGGPAANIAKVGGAATALAQGDLAGAVGNVSKGAGNVANALQQKLAPAQQNTATNEPDDLNRIKQLANV